MFLLLANMLMQAGAQPLLNRYTRYTTRDGICHPTITSLAKDGDGFLWIGTAEGLNCFDGSNFSTFLKQEHGQSLSHNYITSLVTVQENYLFAGTLCGLNIINTRTRQIKNVFF